MPADPTCGKDSQVNSFQKVLQGVKQSEHKYPSHETAVSEDLTDDDSPDIKVIFYFLVGRKLQHFVFLTLLRLNSQGCGGHLWDLRGWGALFPRLPWPLTAPTPAPATSPGASQALQAVPSCLCCIWLCRGCSTKAAPGTPAHL